MDTNIVIYKTLFAVCFLLTVNSGNTAGIPHNFLDSGLTAASSALGESVVAKGVDLSATLYNPSTLVNQPSGALLDYSQPNRGASRSWLAFAAGDKRLKLGLLWKNESLPLSSSKNAYLLSAGVSDKVIRFMPRGFSVGVTLGHVREQISNYSASSFLASAGGSYLHTAKGFTYGLGTMFHNLYFSGLQFTDDGEKEVWPMRLDSGVFATKWGITVFGSYGISQQGTGQIGIAYRPYEFLEFRAGMNGNPRIGLGIEVGKIKLDYAMAMGDITKSHGLTLTYSWGKETKEIDYTNPNTELRARYQALGDSVLADLRYKVQAGDEPKLRDVLRLLAVDPQSEDGWSFYSALTKKKAFRAKIPFSRKARRQYMEFAVAYVMSDLEKAKDLGKRFLTNYPNESIANLVRVILEKDIQSSRTK